MPPGGQTYADNLDFLGGTSIGSEHGFNFGGGASDTFGGFSDRRQTIDLDPFGAMSDLGMPQGFDPLGAYNFGTSYRRRRSAQVKSPFLKLGQQLILFRVNFATKSKK